MLIRRPIPSVKEIERHHEVRATGEYPAFDFEVELAQSVCKLQTFYEWKLQHRPDSKGLGKWNHVSLLKIFTGKS